MITQDAYDALKYHQQDGESLTQAILRLTDTPNIIIDPEHERIIRLPIGKQKEYMHEDVAYDWFSFSKGTYFTLKREEFSNLVAESDLVNDIEEIVRNDDTYWIRGTYNMSYLRLWEGTSTPQRHRVAIRYFASFEFDGDLILRHRVSADTFEFMKFMGRTALASNNQAYIKSYMTMLRQEGLIPDLISDTTPDTIPDETTQDTNPAHDT
jgi:hypothetical protein